MSEKKTLKPKEMAFVQELLKPGATQTSAYLAVSPNVTRASAAELGSKILRRPHVQEHLKEVLTKRYPEMTNTSADVLMEILQGPDSSLEVKLKCVHLLAKLCGWYSPSKSEEPEAIDVYKKYHLPGHEE